MFIVYILLSFVFQCASFDTLTPRQSLRDNQTTLVSVGGTYVLGFFSPRNSTSRYLGIWCNNPSTSPYVWIANRQRPLMDHSGVLSISRRGVLLLQNREKSTIWSSNQNGNAENPIMQLLESGNLVVKDGNEDNLNGFLWQSFDYPSDTLLPGVKIGRNFSTGQDKLLTSWKSENDPAPGQFSLWIDPQGFPQLVLRNGTSMFYRLGHWNGVVFTGVAQLADGLLKYVFVLDKKEVYYTNEVQSPRETILVLNKSGLLDRYFRIGTKSEWKLLYSAPVDPCDKYATCGAYMICKPADKSYRCDCLEGFMPKSPNDSSTGCIRKIASNCRNDNAFQSYSMLKLPDTSGSWFDKNMNLKDCKDKCLNNCSCTAYSNSDIRDGGSGCLLWFDDLIDMKEVLNGNQYFYVRTSSSERGKNKTKVIWITVSFAVFMGLCMVGLVLFIRKRRLRNQNEAKADMELPLFQLSTVVKATDNFSANNKLGQGGFGPVYKGTLIDGQEIAVKRLSKSSTQGLTEFKNEVILIAKLQHRNLVKLLGCCIQGDEKMLIYEFMPNKSLDIFIFDQTRSKLLDWNQRSLIIGGIARGLLYLHQDSRLRIIHRDLKASNVLLDKDMNPKISDFGLARMFGADQTEADTDRVVGTFGYMSPEYAVDGHFSLKSDVFSFGVIVLEIISGKRNRGFSNPNHSHNLLGHAWKLWIEGKALEIVDRTLDDSYAASEVLRCIQLGLLSVQQRPEDRPSMASLVLMLSGEASLPQPTQPGFFTERNVPEVESSSRKSESSSSSKNEITFSSLQAR